MSPSVIRQEPSLERRLGPSLPVGDAPFGLEDLLRLTCAVGLDRDVWSPFVHHDPDAHQAICLHSQPALEIWLICWLAGQSLGIHRHGSGAGCVYVADGCLLEDVLPAGQARGRAGRTYRRGANTAFCFTAGRAHVVRHDGTGPAVSVHAYAPSPTGVNGTVGRPAASRR